MAGDGQAYMKRWAAKDAAFQAKNNESKATVARAEKLRAQHDDEAARMKKIPQPSRSAFPMKVTYKGKTFWQTSKFGQSFKTGEWSMEYKVESDDDRDERVWRSLSGRVYED